MRRTQKKKEKKLKSLANRSQCIWPYGQCRLEKSDKVCWKIVQLRRGKWGCACGCKWKWESESEWTSQVAALYLCKCIFESVSQYLCIFVSVSASVCTDFCGTAEPFFALRIAATLVAKFARKRYIEEPIFGLANLHFVWLVCTFAHFSLVLFALLLISPHFTFPPICLAFFFGNICANIWRAKEIKKRKNKQTEGRKPLNGSGSDCAGFKSGSNRLLNSYLNRNETKFASYSVENL